MVLAPNIIAIGKREKYRQLRGMLPFLHNTI